MPGFWLYPSTVSTGGGGGGTNIVFKDEGVTLTSALASIDLTGKAKATAVGNDVTIVVPGCVADVIANRPAAADANNGEFFWASDTQVMYISDGSTWTPITFTSASISNFTEAAQDAVGAALTDTATIDLTYNDGANTISGIVVAGSIGPTELASTAVAAGSYGSLTQLVSFTVDADGRLTVAANLDLAEGVLDILGNQTFLTDTSTSQWTYDDAGNNLTERYIGDWKQSARVATTVAGTLATSFENGDTIDGVALVTGDRLLIKNQVAGAENGLYIVAASGAPARAGAADTGAKLLGLAVTIREGTVNADTVWINTTNGPITVNVTALVFASITPRFVDGFGIDSAYNSVTNELTVAVDTSAVAVVWVRTPVADANYVGLATDDVVAYTSITANRTFTLPSAAGRTRPLYLIDESGSVSNVTTYVTVNRAGSDTMQWGSLTAQTTGDFVTKNGIVMFEPDGTSKWTVTAQTMDIQPFASSGTWRRPIGCRSTTIRAVGGGSQGGGGCSGSTAAVRYGGTGGQTGGDAMSTYDIADLAATETVTIGAGGTGAGVGGGTGGGNGTDGGVGGDTTFGTTVKLIGGGATAGGPAGTSTAPASSPGQCNTDRYYETAYMLFGIVPLLITPSGGLSISGGTAGAGASGIKGRLPGSGGGGGSTNGGTARAGGAGGTGSNGTTAGLAGGTGGAANGGAAGAATAPTTGANGVITGYGAGGGGGGGGQNNTTAGAAGSAGAAPGGAGGGGGAAVSGGTAVAGNGGAGGKGYAEARSYP